MAIVGIDLGTTMSAVAMVDQFGKAVVLNNAEGDPITPSVVYFESRANKVVGKVARNSAGSDPENVVEAIKNSMGQLDRRTFHGEEYTPQDISAIILKRLKDDAEQACGQSIEGAVITVPACFGDAERANTKEAARIAGLNVLSIIEEPTAAAIAYGLGSGTGVEHDGTVLIFDLGGGTFDLTVMRIDKGTFRMLATDGDRRLGGKDWDKALADYAADAFLQAHGSDPREDISSLADLMRNAEECKKALTRKDSHFVTVQHQGQRHKVEITREKFDEITRYLLEQTEVTTRHVMRYLQDNGKLPGGLRDIDRVLLVGGSSRMPQVARMLKEQTGKDPEMLDVDLVVAKGAALYSIMKAVEFAKETGDTSTIDRMGLPKGFEQQMDAATVIRVCSFALGIAALDGQGQLRNTVLIPKNSELPMIITSDSFSTSVDSQTKIVIELFEGEDRDLKFCTKLGEGEITDIPAGLPRGSDIEITVGLSDEAMVVVEALEPRSGKKCRFEVKREAQMSSAAIALSIERMKRDRID